METVVSEGKCYHAGDSEPNDVTLLWIDTSKGNIIKFYNGETWVTVSAKIGKGG